MPQGDDLLQLTEAGMYCPAGEFHIDPRRAVARSIITHAHADHARSGAAQVWSSLQGADLLRHRLGADLPLRTLQWGEVQRFGDVRVSLHPAGHILGSAQVRVELDGQVWLVSGDFKREVDPTCTPYEVVACDTFICEATFALPVYRWPPIAETAVDIRQWWQENAARGKPSVLFCYALGKAQRLLAELGGQCAETVYLHGAMHALVELYRQAGVAMLPTERVSEQASNHDFTGALILAPPSMSGTTWMRRFKGASTGFASGWMQVRGNRRRRGHDRGFVVSDHADWPALIQTIRDSGAQRIIATHGNTDVLVPYLRELGLQAEALSLTRETDDDG